MFTRLMSLAVCILLTEAAELSAQDQVREGVRRMTDGHEEHVRPRLQKLREKFSDNKRKVIAVGAGTGYALAMCIPHTAIVACAGGIAHGLGATISNIFIGSTGAIGAGAGALGADLVASGRDSDLLQTVEAVGINPTDSQVDRLRDAAVAAPVGAAIVLVPANVLGALVGGGAIYGNTVTGLAAASGTTMGAMAYASTPSAPKAEPIAPSQPAAVAALVDAVEDRRAA